MITELTWDSNFFNRKIGELDVSSQSYNQIETALRKAEAEGFRYLICKIKSQETELIKFLESSGFYLTDIGVIWSIETNKFSFAKRKKAGMRKSIKVADNNDIPRLKEIAKSLFLESRFYSDPFFTKKKADKFYQAWIENSVKGHKADIVFCVPDKGFVTCKRSFKNSGEIVLIGIKKDVRGKGIGRALIEEALKWFITQDIHFVTVRTQLKNLPAMNFYSKMGYSVKEYDIVFAKIL